MHRVTGILSNGEKSEAYIIAAEAYMRMGDNATGVSYLNVLRDRAGVRDFAAGELNQDLILDEQARELGHEGVRWEMLKRLGILYNRVQTYSPTVGANMQPFHVRWPIPKAFVDLTKVPQNQGYE